MYVVGIVVGGKGEVRVVVHVTAFPAIYLCIVYITHILFIYSDLLVLTIRFAENNIA